MLIIFSGGSGVGKNTVIERLLKTGEFALMPTCTTRAKRPGECDLKPYLFLSNEEFQKRLAEGEFYEHEEVHGHFYGTSKKLLAESLATGKILLKDIDVLGTQNLTRMLEGEVKVVSVFLKVDSVEVLRERLIGRGEKDVELRLRRYEMEQSYAVRYDYIINNRSLEETLGFVGEIVGTEKREAIPLCAANAGEIDGARVEKMREALRKGEALPPVKVAFKDGNAYILDGRERFLAARAEGRRIAKEIVPADAAEIGRTEWKKLL